MYVCTLNELIAFFRTLGTHSQLLSEGHNPCTFHPSPHSGSIFVFVWHVHFDNSISIWLLLSAVSCRQSVNTIIPLPPHSTLYVIFSQETFHDGSSWKTNKTSYKTSSAQGASFAYLDHELSQCLLIYHVLFMFSHNTAWANSLHPQTIVAGRGQMVSQGIVMGCANYP